MTNGAQVELVYVLGGEVMSNRLWFWNADHVPTSGELLDLADGVYAWHTTYIMPFLSVDIELATVVARDWSVPFGPFEVTAGAPINGGVNSPSYSANVAVVVGFRWALQYAREKRNKNYVPGIPDSAVVLNTVEPAFQDAMFEGYAALVDWARVIPPGDFWYWVTASAFDGGAPRTEQLFGEATGPLPRSRIILGQRRKRLPLS